MSKDNRVLISEILESIEKIERYVAGATYDSFVRDDEGQDAVIRRLAIIGEAVRNIPDELRQKYPAVPWQKITGMRNILIHEYSDVDIKRVWETAKNELPGLKSEILVIGKAMGLLP